ncbi:S-layer homology domain-containing protein [Paenibacillus soyae]|uniref:S-layer homology domain-containing protein n=1 Tax=Paenibacillus soyae TaxID=2969249 RepID=A0A9X2S846_9BACL|nr:S-layer homology domain-containing protein [Paenibacillus soyae]MCR2803974.1 S-layer homology domain-containing protein [Paenibacillus soyae]
MRKIGIPLAIVAVSAALFTGCGVNDNNGNNNGNNNMNGNQTARSYNNGTILDGGMNNGARRYTQFDTTDTGTGAGTTGTTDNAGTAGNTGTTGGEAGTNGNNGNGNGNGVGNGNGNAGNTGNAAGKKKFKDVPEGQWYSNYIEWGADTGLVNGFPDGSFQPNKPLTRAEVIKILNTMAANGYFNTPTTTPEPTESPAASPSPTPTAEASPSPTAEASPTPAATEGAATPTVAP